MKCFKYILFFLSQIAVAVPVTNYSFPFGGKPYLATLLSAVSSTDQKPKTIEIDGLEGRDQVALVRGQGKLTVSYFAQAKPAPLLFLVAGTGGSALDVQPLFLGSQIFKMGFSVVILPSPFYWSFIVSQSTSAIPGATFADAQDLYRLMERSLEQLSPILKPTSLSLAGYSLGALEAAFVEKLDLGRHEMNFRRVVMINPPLNLNFALQAIDCLYQIGVNKWSNDQRDILWGQALTIGQEVLASGSTSLATVERYIADPTSFLNDEKKLGYLIGSSFHTSLADSIFASQQVNDLGVLATPATNNDRGARMSEIDTFSFEKYEAEFAIPYWTNQLDLTADQLMAASDLRAIQDEIIADPAVYMLHNADDFLTESSDLKFLDAALGKRSLVFPSGGHVGNAAFPENINDLAKILQSGL